MALPVFYAKAMHVGSGRSVKVSLRYRPALGREPIQCGTLSLTPSLWVAIRELLTNTLPLVGSQLIVDERGRSALGVRP